MKVYHTVLSICIPMIILTFLFGHISAAEQERGLTDAVEAEPPADATGLTPPDPNHESVSSMVLPGLLQPSPLVTSMMSQVTPDAIYRTDSELSGQLPVLTGGQFYTISTRHTFSGEAISITTRFVGQKMADSNLAVEYHYWDDATNPNVIGELTGWRRPDEIYLISAHLDSTSPQASSRAPGADDNASGTTAALIIAEILGQYQWDCTLRFALWTGEEQGLLGSQAYVQDVVDDAEDIRGVLNLDMIAWNTPDSPPDMDLHADETITGSMELAQLFTDVVSAYDLALIPQIVPNPTNRSDHASFWQAGYAAILAIEDLSDFNPYYHSIEDTVDKLDLDYFTEFVRAALGTLVHMSECLAVGYLEGTVTAAGSASPIPGASIRAWSAWMPPVTVTSDASGYYSSSLPAGSYTVTTSAIGFRTASISNALVITEATTTQNFSLESMPPFYLPLIRHDD